MILEQIVRLLSDSERRSLPRLPSAFLDGLPVDTADALRRCGDKPDPRASTAPLAVDARSRDPLAKPTPPVKHGMLLCLEKQRRRKRDRMIFNFWIPLFLVMIALVLFKCVSVYRLSPSAGWPRIFDRLIPASLARTRPPPAPLSSPMHANVFVGGDPPRVRVH
jgi:hypothetical protein